MFKLFLSFVFSILSLSIAAQQNPAKPDYKKYQRLESTTTNIQDSGIYVIQTTRLQQIKKMPGVVILRQLDQYHYIIKTRNLLSRKEVPFQFRANSLWKASDNLLKATQRAGKEFLSIFIVLKPETSPYSLNLAAFKDVKIMGRYVYLRIQVRELEELLSHDSIEFAELQRQAKEETLINNLDLSVNKVNRIHADYPLINGSGITVSIKEEKFDIHDIDLLGRSLPSPTQSSVISEHATTMATLVGGNGNSFVKGLGAAPAVQLTSSNYQNLSPDLISQLRALKVSVQNHSYGTGIENYYGLEAAEYDQQIYSIDTLTHVFSSGNSGNLTPSTGVYGGVTNYANLTGTFKQAKNVLVVGATNNEDLAEVRSSAGPAYDGRIKPDLVTAGEDGTSGAAALTSGVVSLLQQEFKIKTGVQASSALIKSILVNSAEDLGPAFPDFKYGFGKLNAYQAIQTIIENRFNAGSTSSGQELSYSLNVPFQNADIKVTLSWNDPPAVLNSPGALVNDLDLWVEDPAGNHIQPWVLSSSPYVDSLGKTAIRSRDSLNNVEQVTLPLAQSGDYTIHVSGHHVATETQPFYISYQVKEAAQFKWTYPLSGDRLFAGENNYLRWESSLLPGSGLISISFNNGSTWQEISPVDLKAGFIKWSSPDIFSQAIIKMTVNNLDYVSGIFSISKPSTLKVGYNCDNGVLLNWPKNLSAASYNLYTIKDNLLQFLKNTTDTTIEIKRQEISTDYFAISAVHASGFEGIRSITIDAGLQGVACYFQSLLADISPERNVILNLKVGSVFGIKTIIWEKQTGAGAHTPLGRTPVSSGLSYSFTDFFPKQGIQYYRAVIETLDGRQIISDLASVIYLDTYKFTLYPNPVTQNFTVLSGSYDVFELNLYNSQGQRVLQKSLNNITQTYNIENLRNGIYVCVISLKGKPLFRSKIIKI